MSCLFIDSQCNEYDSEDIYNALRTIGAHDCDTLFMHSDIMFGKLASGLKRNDVLSELYSVLGELGVKNLIVPTFTYSFCNHEVYDVKNSRTSMGALNEFIRKQDGRVRTLDPLLSFSVPESLGSLFSGLGSHSLGVGSGFDIIHSMDGVKFLFFGARMGNCFTYVHYVEKMLDVCYRFDLPFDGTIVDDTGHSFDSTQYIHTACYGVKPADFYYFEDELQEAGFLKKIPFGDKSIACITENHAYKEIKSHIEKNICYFLEQPFESQDLVHKYTKGLDGERITHC